MEMKCISHKLLETDSQNLPLSLEGVMGRKSEMDLGVVQPRYIL